MQYIRDKFRLYAVRPVLPKKMGPCPCGPVFGRRCDRDKMLKMLDPIFLWLSGNFNAWFGVRAQKLVAVLVDVQKLLHYHNYMTSVSPADIIIDNIDTHGGLF